MPQEITQEYAIAIGLNPEWTKQAQILNSTAQDQLALENPSNIWHITLYHGAYKKEDLPEIYSKLQSLVSQRIILNFSKIYSTADRWIDWKVEKTPELELLHTAVVKLASPHHQRPLQRSADVYATLNNTQQAQIDEYGVSGILELYNPHSTVFYQFPPDERLQSVSEMLPETIEISCVAERIVLGELGYNGNITKVIYEHNLA